MKWDVEIRSHADSSGEEYFDLYINGKLRFCTQVFEEAVKRERVIYKEYCDANA